MSNEVASNTILVVEDRVDVRLLLADVFAGEGYRVLIAGNGREALRTLEHQSVNVILTDLRMPLMDGVRFARAVRADEQLRHIPIILLSATPMNETWRSLGIFDAFLWKPTLLEEIIAAVQHVQQNGAAGSSLVGVSRKTSSAEI
ncbi:CheY-like chemotaxis protein [Herbaspirillum sp. 1173]|uniref:response regulator n=1 Tax=Herbaspirillum sp. 1173 TaxID=2817734 RepID=UPI0028665AE7|nr:response regulator [Herbaspirillum sp. 1173]MDR6739567.1 CheY-like chemotaxis protein [Herbaspirillum sp. 1173]